MFTSRLSIVLGILYPACQHVKMYRHSDDRHVPTFATQPSRHVADALLRRGSISHTRFIKALVSEALSIPVTNGRAACESWSAIRVSFYRIGQHGTQYASRVVGVGSPPQGGEDRYSASHISILVQKGTVCSIWGRTMTAEPEIVPRRRQNG